MREKMREGALIVDVYANVGERGEREREGIRRVGRGAESRERRRRRGRGRNSEGEREGGGQRYWHIKTHSILCLGSSVYQ